MADVQQITGVPEAVTPRAPAGEQYDPALTMSELGSAAAGGAVEAGDVAGGAVVVVWKCFGSVVVVEDAVVGTMVCAA